MEDRGQPHRQAQRHQERDERQRHHHGSDDEPAEPVALVDGAAPVAQRDRECRDHTHDDGCGERRRPQQVGAGEATHRGRHDRDHPRPEPPPSAAQRVVADQPRHHRVQRDGARHPRCAVQHVDDIGRRHALRPPPRLPGEPGSRQPAPEAGQGQDPAHRVRTPGQQHRRRGAVDARHGRVHEEEPQVLVDRRTGGEQECGGEHGKAPGEDGRGRPHPGPGRVIEHGAQSSRARGRTPPRCGGRRGGRGRSPEPPPARGPAR